MQKFGGSRNILSDLVASLFGLIAIVLILEIAGRLYPTYYTCKVDYPVIYQPDEKTGYRYIPSSEGVYRHLCAIKNTVRINSLGFHDIERKIDQQGERIRVLAIGDSHTASIEVKTEETWTQIAEGILAEQNIEVFNLGIDGTGTDAHVEVVRRYAPALRPNIVVLAFGSNDIQDIRNSLLHRESSDNFVIVYENDKQRKELLDYLAGHHLGPLLRWLGEYSHVARFVAGYLPSIYTIKSNYLSPSRLNIPVVREQRNLKTEKLLGELVDLSGMYGFRLVVVPVPYRQDPEMSIRALQNNITPSLYDSLEIVDIAPSMNKRVITDGKDWDSLFLRKDGHYNSYGQRVFGMALSAELLQKQLVPSIINH